MKIFIYGMGLMLPFYLGAAESTSELDRDAAVHSESESEKLPAMGILVKQDAHGNKNIFETSLDQGAIRKFETAQIAPDAKSVNELDKDSSTNCWSSYSYSYNLSGAFSNTTVIAKSSIFGSSYYYRASSSWRDANGAIWTYYNYRYERKGLFSSVSVSSSGIY